MSTQWRTSAAGYTGMDYGVLPVVFDLCRIPKRQRTEVFDDLQVMEAGFLDAMTAESRKR